MSSFGPSQSTLDSGMCRAGCGFYGSSGNDGYCSLCFKTLCLSSSTATTSSAPSPPASSNCYCGASSGKTSIRLNDDEKTTPEVDTSSSSDFQNSSTETTERQNETSPTNNADNNKNNNDDLENCQSCCKETVISDETSFIQKTISSSSFSSCVSSFAQPLVSSKLEKNNYSVEEEVTVEIEDHSSSKIEKDLLPIDENNNNKVVQDSTVKENGREEIDAQQSGRNENMVVVDLPPNEEPPIRGHDHPRCFLCNKKLGLLRFQCRCGNAYCRPHQHAESHKCPFDYKAHHQRDLIIRNPKVIAAQIEKLNF